MTAARALAASVVTTAALLGTGWLSRAPYDAPGTDSGGLRLSWRLRADREETCRTRTQQELDALPVHMRTPEVCDRRLGAYRLVVGIDDAKPDTSLVVPGGARSDRPLFVLREIPLAPGPHHVRLHFDHAGAPDEESLPITLDTVLHAEAGRVELITIDADARAFVHVPRPR